MTLLKLSEPNVLKNEGPEEINFEFLVPQLVLVLVNTSFSVMAKQYDSRSLYDRSVNVCSTTPVNMNVSYCSGAISLIK